MLSLIKLRQHSIILLIICFYICTCLFSPCSAEQGESHIDVTTTPLSKFPMTHFTGRLWIEKGAPRQEILGNLTFCLVCHTTGGVVGNIFNITFLDNDTADKLGSFSVPLTTQNEFQNPLSLVFVKAIEDRTWLWFHGHITYYQTPSIPLEDFSHLIFNPTTNNDDLNPNLVITEEMRFFSRFLPLAATLSLPDAIMPQDISTSGYFALSLDSIKTDTQAVLVRLIGGMTFLDVITHECRINSASDTFFYIHPDATTALFVASCPIPFGQDITIHCAAPILKPRDTDVSVLTQINYADVSLFAPGTQIDFDSPPVNAIVAEFSRVLDRDPPTTYAASYLYGDLLVSTLYWGFINTPLTEQQPNHQSAQLTLRPTTATTQVFTPTSGYTQTTSVSDRGDIWAYTPVIYDNKNVFSRIPIKYDFSASPTTTQDKPPYMAAMDLFTPLTFKADIDTLQQDDLLIRLDFFHPNEQIKDFFYSNLAAPVVYPRLAENVRFAFTGENNGFVVDFFNLQLDMNMLILTTETYDMLFDGTPDMCVMWPAAVVQHDVHFSDGNSRAEVNNNNNNLHNHQHNTNNKYSNLKLIPIPGRDPISPVLTSDSGLEMSLLWLSFAQTDTQQTLLKKGESYILSCSELSYAPADRAMISHPPDSVNVIVFSGLDSANAEKSLNFFQQHQKNQSKLPSTKDFLRFTHTHGGVSNGIDGQYGHGYSSSYNVSSNNNNNNHNNTNTSSSSTLQAATRYADGIMIRPYIKPHAKRNWLLIIAFIVCAALVLCVLLLVLVLMYRHRVAKRAALADYSMQLMYGDASDDQLIIM